MYDADMITAASLLNAIDSRRVALAALTGSSTPLSYSEVGRQIGAHSAVFSRLKKGDMPSEKMVGAMLSWIGDEKLAHCPTCPHEELTIVGDTDLPVADRDMEWDGQGARQRVFEYYTDDDGDVDVSGVSRAFLYRDPEADPQTMGAYRLGFADIVNGELQIVPRGVAATAGGRGVTAADIPDDEKDDIESRICGLYDTIRDEYEDWPSCPFRDEEPEPVDDAELGEDALEETPSDLSGVRTIWAFGRLSDSEDPETQAAVMRARELIREGAVGVSVALDVHPDDVAEMANFPVNQETGGVEAPEGYRERLRIRHTALVGTPAYADAKLTIDDDGNLSGPVVFEGIYTGDGRLAATPGQIDLDASLTPSPIIYDRVDEDHDGATIGYLTSFERRDGMETSARTELDDEAITASMKALEMPARYFAKTVPSKAEPMRISAPDENGYRSIRGLAAPSGVCIRNSMKCWTWPGDKDKKHSHFHTGTLLRLDNGDDIRVGALTIGGAHLDAALAKQGVSANDTSNYRDNANRVFALVRVWETRFGLMMSGVIPPDVSEGDVARALACSPSIEFWPDKGGRTLVGLHLVPTPGLPVLASMGSAEMFVTDNRIEMEEGATLASSSEVEGEEPEIDQEEQDGEPDPITKADLMAAIEALSSKLSTVSGKVDTILALTPIDNIEIE